MKLSRIALVAGLAMIIGAANPATAQQRQARSTPAATIRSFYKFHLAHDTGFTPKNIKQRRTWLSPELYQLILSEFRREAEWVKANPDQVPYFDGDPFTNSQELPNSFRVAEPIIRRTLAKSDVTFVWTTDGRTVAEHTVSVALTRLGNSWLISNIVGNEGQPEAVDFRKQLLRKVYQP